MQDILFKSLRDEGLDDPTGQGQPTVLRSYDADEMRRWIKACCRILNITPSELARRSDIATTTLTRFLNDDGAKHKLSGTTIGKINKAIDLLYHETHHITYQQPGSPYSRHQYADITHNGGDWENLVSSKLPEITHVVGGVRAGLFSEAFEWDRSKRYPVPVPQMDEYDGSPKFALEVEGRSMDQVYPHGSIVICIPLIHADRNPIPGERVVVQQFRKDGTIEATVKEFRIDSDGVIWLWPRSTQPEHQTPINFKEPSPDIESVEITAIVIASIQPEPHDPILP